MKTAADKSKKRADHRPDNKGFSATPEGRTCLLYELSEATGAGYRNVFVVGSLHHRSERVAVASQQTRALNLVHSLIAEARIRSGDKICVIGGGASGLTAAAFAMSKGVLVTVIESRKPLWNLRGCRTRWLHPNLFRRWPEPEWQCTATNFPVMNWYAGYACDVGDLLWSKYQAFESEQLRNRRIKHPQLQQAHDVRVEETTAGWSVSWQPNGERGATIPRQNDTFDAVVIAIGFGSEARPRDAEAGSYWLDDTLERERPDRATPRYLISGTGDGGLTDLLRIRIDDFRHHHLRDGLLSLELARTEIKDAFEEIERRAELDAAYDPTSALRDLAAEHKAGELMKNRRPTTAVLTNTSGGMLRSSAWRVSKFLAAALLDDDKGLTEYRRGPATWAPLVQSSSLVAEHPPGFAVQFADSTDHVDAIVVRHGPAKVRVGSDDVPAADAQLMLFGFDRRTIEAARKKWAAAVDSKQVTDELIAPCVDAEAGRRSRRSVIVPALGGRTVIGMLSRLVSAVSPEQEADDPPRSLRFSDPLVRDEAANALAPHSDRMPHKAHGEELDDNGWRLGAELDRGSAVEVIAAADASLAHLWGHTRAKRGELERRWVLPRPVWMTPDPKSVLRNTYVARHWAQWELRYEKIPGKSSPRMRARSDALQRAIIARLDKNKVAQQAFRAEHVLAVVDCCAWRARVAACRRGGVRATRLARELGVDLLFVALSDEFTWLT